MRRPLVAALAMLLAGCAAGPARKVPLDLSLADLQRVAASRPAPARWRVHLGPVLVEAITPLADGTLLVATVNDAPGLAPSELVAVDPDTGAMRWRVARNPGASVLLGQTRKVLVFLNKTGEGAYLLSRDADDGSRRWQGQPREGLEAVFLGGADLIVTSEPSGHQVVVRGLTPAGNKVWEQKIEGGEKPPGLVPLPGQVAVFAKGLRLFDTKGREAGRVALASLPAGVQPRVSGRQLFSPDGPNCLASIVAGRGQVIWHSCLPEDRRLTSLQPAGGFLFAAEENSEGQAGLTMWEAKTGRRRWNITTEDPLASNILLRSGKIFAATTRDLLMLDAENGALLKRHRLMTRGSRYPAEIVRTDQGIAYVGEFLMVGLDEEGNLLYRQGMSPISPEASLAGFDAVIRRLKRERAFWAGMDSSESTFLSAFHHNEMIRYQNLATADSNGLHRDLNTTGMHQTLVPNAFNATIAQREMNQAFARQEAILGAFHAGLGALEAWGRAMKLAEYRTRLERRLFMRRTLLAAYRQGTDGVYAWRPVTASLHYVATAAVDLETGKRADTVTSPTYLGYGLWSVLDARHGVVYHHGVGMEPGQYRWSEPHKTAKGFSARTLDTYLVAQPVRLPH